MSDIDNRKLAAHSRDFIEVRPPYRLPNEKGSVSQKELSETVLQTNRVLRELFTKVYGRIALNDLNGYTQNVISNKLDGEGVSSWIQQHPDQINAVINKAEIFLDEEYLKDKVWRGVDPPTDAAEGMIWIDQSVSPSQIKSWDGTEWQNEGMVPDDYYTLAQTESMFQQTADEIALKVSTSTYDMEKVHRGEVAPSDPVLNMLWLDTSQTPNILQQYDGEKWVETGASTFKAAGITIDSDGLEMDGAVVSIITKLFRILAGDPDGSRLSITTDDDPALRIFDDNDVEQLSLTKAGLDFANASRLVQYSIGTKTGIGIFV